MSKKSVDRQYLAAAFFAAAAYKHLPEVQFIRSGKDQLGFYYDFYLPYPLLKSQLEELERTATQLSENAKISFKEMMIDNAKNYLSHLGQPKREIKASSSLVRLIEIDHFIDFIPTCGPVESEKKMFIKLRKFLSIDQDTCRVYGFVFESAKECSKFLKKFKNYEKHNCLTIGTKRNWFTLIDNQLFFYPKGIILKNKIFKMIFDELLSLQFKPIQSYPASHDDFLKVESSNLNKVFEVVSGKNLEISEDDPFNTQINLFTKQTTLILNGEFEPECISSLQSIVKMLNILSFRCEFELCVSSSSKFKERKKVFEKILQILDIKYELKDTWTGCELKIFAKDDIGRKWNVSCMRLCVRTIESNFCSSLNRWIALLTENDKLDFGFLPEHLRVMLLDKKYIDYADDIKNVIQNNGFIVEIDASDKSLNEKIFDAKIQDVPFIAVIGEKEVKSKTIALRSENGFKMNPISLCELLEKLKLEG